MAEIRLPQELMDKAIESMVSKLIADGMNYSLRQAVEARLSKRLTESGIIDTLADAILTRIITDQDAIIAHAGDAIIEGIGKALGETYKAAADEIIQKVRRTRF